MRWLTDLILTLFIIIPNVSYGTKLEIALVSAGNLINQIDLSTIGEISELTISGEINGTDVLTINKCVNLKTLDLQNATIKEGGMPYYQHDNNAWECEDNTITPFFLYGCDNIQNFLMPLGTTAISDKAFHSKRSLKTIKLNDGLQTIGESCFVDCVSLMAITIPASVESIGDKSFNGCISLNKVVFNDSEKVLSIGENWKSNWNNGLFNECKIETVYIGRDLNNGCFNNNPVNKVEISNNVSFLPNDLFLNCEKLSEIYIPSSVKAIGSRCFYSSGLQFISGMTGVETISDEVFTFCPLNSFVAQNSLKYIGAAFGYCKNLCTVDLSISHIEYLYGTFESCENLKTIILPQGLIEVGESTFENCKYLDAIILPSSLETIGRRAFGYCYSLNSIEFPYSLKEIREEAFYSCSKITQITLPHSIVGIGYKAFYDCKSLSYVEFESSDKQLVFNYELEDRGGERERTGVHWTYHYNRVPHLDLFAGCPLKKVVINRQIKNTRQGKELYHTRTDSYGDVLNYYYLWGENILFDGIETIEEVEFGGKIHYIEDCLFSRCRNLSKLFFNDCVIDSIGEFSFSSCNLPELALPISTTKIKKGAFSSNKLKTICINGICEFIDETAFVYNQEIDLIQCLNPIPPHIFENIFDADVYNNSLLQVPTSCKNRYWIHPYWGLFKNITESEFPITTIRFEGVSDIINLKVGEEFRLSTAISPNYPNKNIYYHSENIDIAEVSNTGLICAISEGRTIISATCDGLSTEMIVVVEGASGIKEIFSDEETIEIYDVLGNLLIQDKQSVALSKLQKDRLYIIKGKTKATKVMYR